MKKRDNVKMGFHKRVDEKFDWSEVAIVAGCIVFFTAVMFSLIIIL
jgi:hypothetical protein